MLIDQPMDQIDDDESANVTYITISDDDFNNHADASSISPAFQQNIGENIPTHSDKDDHHTTSLSGEKNEPVVSSTKKNCSLTTNIQACTYTSP